jgi:alkylhydroperoxidase family enzyme
MNAELAQIAIRIKPLSIRHRLAHLRALIRHESEGSMRAGGLAALLRDQSAVTAADENHTQ